MKDEVTNTESDLLCYNNPLFDIHTTTNQIAFHVMLEEALTGKSSLKVCTIPRVLVTHEYQMLLYGTRTYSTFWNVNVSALITNSLNVYSITAPWPMVNANERLLTSSKIQ